MYNRNCRDSESIIIAANETIGRNLLKQIVNYLTMVQPTEFRKGNWVNVQVLDLTWTGRITEVNPQSLRIGGGIEAKLESFFPIHITESWLQNLGFEFISGSPPVIQTDLNKRAAKHYRMGSNFSILFSAETKCTFFANACQLTLEYVHQLQNLYLEMTGNELELTKISKEEKDLSRG